MTEPILSIEDLRVSVGGKRILNGVNLSVRDGEVVCLFGPNGAGKSTLLYTILGYPGYTIESGRILFKGVDVSTLSIDERVRMGLGIAFQHAPRLRGVKLIDLIHLAAGDGLTDEEIEEAAARLRMSSFLHRDVNYGFSGGEIKRSEILQLIAARSDFLLLDEPDSGVDVENVELLGREINQLLRGRSGLIITHVGYILNFIRADRAVVLYEGKVACEGDPYGILKDIKDKGYKACLECERCSPPTRKE
jgi:Fe-S cluster assembly ATP-binding protein